jgi:hypothetical protein
VSGTVTPTEEEAARAEVRVDWFIGRGIGFGSTSSYLDFGFSGNEPDRFEMIVGTDTSFSFEPSEIERFELEVDKRNMNF